MVLYLDFLSKSALLNYFAELFYYRSLPCTEDDFAFVVFPDSESSRLLLVDQMKKRILFAQLENGYSI